MPEQNDPMEKTDNAAAPKDAEENGSAGKLSEEEMARIAGGRSAEEASKRSGGPQ